MNLLLRHAIFSKGGSKNRMAKRKLTISYLYYPSNTIIPILRLQGCWFEKLGFKIGDEVEIHQGEQDELIIRKVSNKERKVTR